MKKYAIPTAMLAIGHEIVSILALIVAAAMVIGDFGVSGALPVSPFALEDASAGEPTAFDATFLAGETVYRLVVEATASEVLYESLEVVRERGSF